MTDETDTPDPENAADAAGAAPEATATAEDAGADPASGSASGAGVEALAAELAEARDQALRMAAEAENVRKRAEREVADARAYAVASFARDLLSVNDNLARALEALTPEMREGMREAGRTLLDGIEMTQKELRTVLSRHAVEPVSAEPGSAFDPNVHQAVAQIPSEHPAGAIVEVMQSGWKIGDRVLRAAMVAVSAGAPAGGAPPSGQGGANEGGAGAGESGDPPPAGSSVDTQV